LKSAYALKNFYLQVGLNDIQSSNKGESRYKAMNGKAAIQLTEQYCVGEDRNLSGRMLEEMTGINRGTERKILEEGLKKKKVFAQFVPICKHRIRNINALNRLLNLLT
jgi:hypothetical protein